MTGRARRATAPTWAVIVVLSLARTTVSLQQTMLVPLLPGFQRLLQVSAGCSEPDRQCPVRW